MHINWSKNQICVLGCMLRSHARNGNEFQTPGHRWLPAKHWDTWFLNSSKSKACLKFMKLGMLSWSGINMPWWKFGPIWGRFGYMLLTTSMMVSVGNVPPLGTKRYPLPLIAFKKISHVNIEQQESCVQFWNFWGSFGHFYTFTGFSKHFMRIIQI